MSLDGKHQTNLPHNVSAVFPRQCHEPLACGAGRFRDLKRHERITASWFAMTGVVHFIIEGARAGVPADTATNIRMLSTDHVRYPALHRRIRSAASELLQGHIGRRPA